MSVRIGQTLGHYTISSKLGEGGMGIVYRAHDERLDREVAIKVLPEEVAQDQGRLARFDREARAVAMLDHPNILSIHDYGSHQGVTYAVTELLEGQTLRERIPENGLGWQYVAEIGAAVAISSPQAPTPSRPQYLKTSRTQDLRTRDLPRYGARRR